MKIGVLLLAALLGSTQAGDASSKTPSDGVFLARSLMAWGVQQPRQLVTAKPNFPVDISGYSVQYKTCQAVKSIVQTPEGEERTHIERYVVFRLCPEHDCTTASSCHDQYGEYLLELGSYLKVTSDYFHETSSAMCAACNGCGHGTAEETASLLHTLNDFGMDCQTCHFECDHISNMEDYGYFDATEFMECQMIYDSEDGKEQLYAGPICGDNGDKITIGVFKDDECQQHDPSKSIDDGYLKTEDGESFFRLSHSFLRMTYTETCMSCQEDNVEGLHDLRADQDDLDSVKQFCETMYTKAGKCEYTHGFQSGASSGHLKPRAQEEAITCDFIQEITQGAFTDDGDMGNNREEDIEEEKIFEDTTVIIVVGASVILSLSLLLVKKCTSGPGYAVVEHAEDSDDSEGGFSDEKHAKFTIDDDDETEEESSGSYYDDCSPLEMEQPN
jgi:hypothetical protein